MGKVKDEKLFLLIKNFLLVYLPVQRNASELTVKNYRTTINQYLKFLAEQNRTTVMSVSFEMFSLNSVNAFLDHLSTEKQATPTTRNSKLAAIRAFVSYASACHPEYISLSGELAEIKSQKNDPFAKVDYMSEEAVSALLKAPDTNTDIGIRDQFIMIFLYDTGARIQELLRVRLRDLRIDKTPTVTLFGKGRKIRVVPLMKETVSHLQNYLRIFHPGEPMVSDEPLFYVERNGKRSAICDDTVRIRLQKYAEEARKTCKYVPERMYPHLWRHTRAMHLYQHGMDLTMVSQWLGHSQLQTTLIYARADTEDKRRAIEEAMSKGGIKVEHESNYTVTDEEILKRLYGL